MQKPTGVAIREQVPGPVVETALKTSSKKKRKSVAKTITSQQSNKSTNETVQNLDQEFVDRICVLTETGKIDDSEYKYYQPSMLSNEQRLASKP